MKLPVSILIVFLLTTTVASAQIYNESGTIRILKGSSIVCLGNFINSTGTVTNDGKLEVRGNFNNKNIYNSAAKEDTLLLSGEGNVTVNTGSAILNNLQVNKTNGGGVILTANAVIEKSFDLHAGNFSTDPLQPFELAAPASASFTFGTGTQITGKVRRTNWANDTAVVFHQTDMKVATAGGIAPASLLINMLPNTAAASIGQQVKRYFYFSPVGGNNYTADITFPYSQQELNSNNEANLIAWYNDPLKNWSQKLTGNTINTTSHYLVSAGIKAGILANREWKLADMEYDSKNPNLFVYPIPARNAMNILLTADKNKKVAIELSDVSGKVCQSIQKDIQKGLNTLSLNVRQLSAGQYILKVKEDNSIQTKVVLID